MAGAVTERLSEAQLATEDRLYDGLARPVATVGLAVVVVCSHVAVGSIPYLRGNAPWWAVFVARRGRRLLTRTGALRTRALDRGELWRLWSAAFLHADGLHLLLNTVSLVVVGRVVEAIFGPVRLLWVFFVSAVAGGSASWLIGQTETSVGSSGGIFGLLGALVVFGWRHREALPDDLARLFGRRVLAHSVVYVGLGLLLPFIDDLAHVGGLLAGAVCGALLDDRVTDGSRRPSWVRGVGMTGVLVLASIVALQRVVAAWPTLP